MPKKSKTSSTDQSTANDHYSYEIMSKHQSIEELKSVMITISVPIPGDICPLTLEPIAESSLDCLPGVTFFEDRPQHTKITLPCSHSFSAIPLIYSFCKNTMICPCCRGGFDTQANIDYLPNHLRADMKKKIESVLKAEEESDQASYMQDLINNFVIDVGIDTLATTGALGMSIALYDVQSYPRTRRPYRPIYTIRLPLERVENNGILIREPLEPNQAQESLQVYSPPRNNFRVFLDAMNAGYNAFRVFISARFSSNSSTQVMELESTEIIHIPTENSQLVNNRFVWSGHFSNIDVLFQLDEATGTYSINNVLWIPESGSIVGGVMEVF